jgi:hypothetical protein
LQDQGASLPNNGRLDHLLIHMQLETQALWVLVISYCCSTYRVADPFSSMGTFSSSSIGGPVFHPLPDCEHPLLCLPGLSIVSQETAISGSFQQNLACVCNGVSVCRLIMGWIRSLFPFCRLQLCMNDSTPFHTDAFQFHEV